jgi:Fe-S oxidoreductase
MAKTTRITIETENLLVVRKGKTIVTWCPACCADVEVMIHEGDSLGEDIPSSYLAAWLAAGKLHLWRPAQGAAQICLPLAAAVLRTRVRRQAR